ncbi:MAG: MFS transporter [Rhodobacteraceae bacterium]|nr:MFS transporter [Paracoccaceae bacterium]
MTEIPMRKRIWGWFFFDWASQPYNTLLLTFIFGPYFAQTATSWLVSSGVETEAAKAEAQALWGYGLAVTGILIAILAPILGAVADSTGRKLSWIWFFSILYAVGAWMCWYSSPDQFDATRVLIWFGVGLIGMEFATIFTNALLPSMGAKSELGMISGSGWAFGYLGGILALLIIIAFFQSDDSGLTLLKIKPLFDLDPSTGADTRIVGPFCAIWFIVFMIPFFLWVREIPTPRGHLSGQSLLDLWGTIRTLPSHGSMLAYLGSSMFYRDALNGMYTFGGIYAFGVLGWSIMQIGIFGIVAAISGALFAWLGGMADRSFGPKSVIVVCCFVLVFTAGLILSISPTHFAGIRLVEGSSVPDSAFYVAGILIGAAGGALQSASRNMMTRQGNSARMTEAFGLYALSGKATSFLAPALIAVASDLTGSQRLGVTPLIALFAIALILLIWVKSEGDQQAWSREQQPS